MECEPRFSGKERDAESGNDYFGARYYASTMGRFLSPDWSAKVAPVPYAKLDNPQTLNLYNYVQNNPLGRVDADGHESGYQYDPNSFGMREQQDAAADFAEFLKTPVVHATLNFLSNLFNPTKNCPNCQIGIMPFGMTGGLGGSWVAESLAGRSLSAISYEQQITGNAGKAFLYNGVKFDGTAAGALIEAKGPGYAALLSSPGVGESVQQKLLQQAVSQVKAANGASITWNVAEEGAANGIRSLFQKQGIKGIKVVYTPPK